MFGNAGAGGLNPGALDSSLMNNILSTPSSEKSQGSRISRDDYKNE
jgi:hypothetical protein